MATYVFDAWAGKTPEELKEDCQRLNRALHDWQHIAMELAACAPEAIKKLPPRSRDELENMIAAYSD